VYPGVRIQTGAGGGVALAYPDGGKIALKSGTALKLAPVLWRRSRELTMEAGTLSASISRQPARCPLVVLTPHARLTVMGTRFVVTVTREVTRLEVEAGTVRYLDLSSNRFIDAEAGTYTQSGREVELVNGTIPDDRPSALPVVTGFTLMNSDSDRPIKAFDPIPPDAVLRLSRLPTRSLNIRVNTSPEIVGSVSFSLQGPKSSPGATNTVDDVAPYFLAGDHVRFGSPENAKAWTPAQGRYELTATPFALAGGEGNEGTPVTICFTVKPY